MAFDRDFIDELKVKNDIESVVASYVTLRRRGSNLVGLCPFHGEKTPSFTVFPQTESFYCFGCGTGGDVIGFIRRIENLDYLEAVKLLADRAGMVVPQGERDDSLSKMRTRVLEANRQAARFFHKLLLSESGKAALDYLHSRGIDDSTIKYFGMGFAPDAWDTLGRHMTGKGFTVSELQAADLLVKGRNGTTYDKFRNRIIFPIIDLRGNVIAFGARALDNSPAKYLNTSDTIVFKKSHNLFALNFAKNSKERALILAEGYMDVAAMHQHGFKNSVAALGTALTQQQANLISRYAGEVIIAYDSDEAGHKATQRAIRILKDSNLKVKVLNLSGYKDPDEFIRKKGAESFRLLLERCSNDTEYRLEKIKEKYDTASADGRVSYLKEAIRILAGVFDVVERDVYALKLAHELNVDKGAIMLQIESQVKKRPANKSRQQIKDIKKISYITANKINPKAQKYIKAAAAEEAIISMLMSNPDIFPLLSQRLKIEDFVTDFNARLYRSITEKLSKGMAADITCLSDEYSEQEISYIAGIIARNADFSYSEKELIRLVEVLKTEKEKLKISGNASNEEILEYTKKLLAQKNRGVQK